MNNIRAGKYAKAQSSLQAMLKNCFLLSHWYLQQGIGSAPDSLFTPKYNILNGFSSSTYALSSVGKLME